MGNWFDKDDPGKETVNSLSSYIYALENSDKICLPDLRETDNLYIFSDYSGSKDQQLISYSIVITKPQAKQEVMRQFLPDLLR